MFSFKNDRFVFCESACRGLYSIGVYTGAPVFMSAPTNWESVQKLLASSGLCKDLGFRVCGQNFRFIVVEGKGDFVSR